MELAPLGITAGVVEPGLFRTDFLDARSLHTSTEITDYAQTSAGKMRGITAQANHNQAGDPIRGAAVMVDAIEGGAFPERLFLRSDTVTRVSAKLDAVRTELSRQHDAARSTDYSA
ncbi:hypothetical protein D9V34_01960 [Mycetocola lacteus]|uniref:SDR family NAD(P)-dependent oxidoreductase n=1 Tax=Mycetocola lacteus TaxID=76637 RepID=A0A3L7AXX5_9MICO|nr:hypothetical protein [Mycetocola lacteus]RLP84785.1 hypothetical protein D9V34_01960 [Mycetocola lacteus]